MIDIYKTWIRDFRIDGFRIDTMKHVDDEFWQKFAPAVERYAKSQGKPEFFMFGEVADDHEDAITSHYTTHDEVQARARLPVPGRRARFAANSRPTARAARLLRRRRLVHGRATRTSTSCRPSSATTTWAASACSSARPTRAAADAELLERDRLAHELMYFSRGNPVVYYGDEQGFIGDGGDQDARQDMFPSAGTRDYNDDDAA